MTCGDASVQKAAAAEVGAHRLERPPIADQMHVVVWVVKANDVRCKQGKYREIINFFLHQLKSESEYIFVFNSIGDTALEPKRGTC